MNTAACGGNKKARLSPRPISALPPANLWVWLRQTLEKTAPMGGNFSENPNLARPTGFEPAISSVTGRRDRPTSLRAHVLNSMNFTKIHHLLQ